MERGELLQLYKKEKDPNVKDRLMLNIRVRFKNHSITEAAHSLGKVTSWGSKWCRRFAKAGLEGLQNLPRPGRPTRITGEETVGIRKEMDGRQYWTVGGARELISKVTGVTYSVSSVYKMLRRWGYFLRAPVKRHVRRPPDEEIARFQKELAELIPKKIEEGYTVAVQDETIVTADARPRRVYTRKGRRAVCTVTGSHGKTVVYGLQTMDGRGMVRAVRQVHHGELCRLSEEGPPEVPKDGNDTGQGRRSTRLGLLGRRRKILGGWSWSISRRDARISTRWRRSGGR